MKKNPRGEKALTVDNHTTSASWKSRPMMTDSNLTPDERRRTRNWHRELLQQMKENAPVTWQTSTPTHALYESIRYPRESILDSLCLEELESALGRQGWSLNNTDITKVSLIRASGKVCAAHSKFDWETLGNLTGGMFQSVPETNFMFGLLETTEVKKPSKRRRRLTPKDVDIQETQPRAYIAKKGEIEETQGRRLRVLEDVVARAHSFEQTVVNLFDTSFLVHQRSLGICVAATGLPFLENSEGSASDEPDCNHQSIVSITPAQWEELASACGQDEPLVGHREEM
ncbi:hypothetical protein V7S43_000602 [Phytophthora oleae]|uniref:Non-structural maintenance of chromosomes element 4 n=1 Tax=Phytophthora oleae TaxID=2107226 RepID=A0ABD3G8Z5_9STRA